MNREDAPAPTVKEVAGRYRLLHLIGRGGMGEVWGATDSVLGRRVAVKLLPALAGEDLKRRFAREAATLAALRHPAITVVHDAGQQSGLHFIVMELLEGLDLAQLIAGQRDGLPLVRVLDLATQISEAIGAAHSEGVVHRDLKPANVFVQAGDRVKVCDFGIARTSNATSPLTAAGQIIGTPPYMSPEQCSGGDVDSRSDLYSLGCVLFEMLTGQTPFPVAQSIYALLHKHISEPPPLLSDVRAGLPASLENLVSALLAKDPAARPESAAMVLEALRAVNSPRTPTMPDVAPAAAGVASAPVSDVTAVSPSNVDAALRIAGLIRDPQAKSLTLHGLIGPLVSVDPDRAASLVAEIPLRHRSASLVALARALDKRDPRVRRALDEADRLIFKFPAGESEQDARDLVHLGREWVAHDPERAVHCLERASRHIAMMDSPGVYSCAWLLADATSTLARADPVTAARLMSEVERYLADLDVDYRPAWGLPRQLGRIAVAGQTADPTAAERLLQRAELTALEGERSELAIQCLVQEIARVDLPRAELLVGKTTDAYGLHLGWAALIETVGKHRPELLDEVLKNFTFHHTARTATPAGKGDLDSLWRVAAAAAPFAPGWAQQVASQVTNLRGRYRAFHDMAVAAAGSHPHRAGQWLHHAYALLIGDNRTSSLRPFVYTAMGEIAKAALSISPPLSKVAARYIARRIDDEVLELNSRRLVDLAKDVAAIDPYSAIRIISIIEKQEEALFEIDRCKIVGALIEAAATLADSDLDVAEQTVQRAARSLTSPSNPRLAARVNWTPAVRLFENDSRTARQLFRLALEEMQGETHDHASMVLARTLAAVDLPYAEQVAKAVANRFDRDKALSGIVRRLMGQSY